MSGSQPNRPVHVETKIFGNDDVSRRAESIKELNKYFSDDYYTTMYHNSSTLTDSHNIRNESTSYFNNNNTIRYSVGDVSLTNVSQDEFSGTVCK